MSLWNKGRPLALLCLFVASCTGAAGRDDIEVVDDEGTGGNDPGEGGEAGQGGADNQSAGTNGSRGGAQGGNSGGAAGKSDAGTDPTMPDSGTVVPTPAPAGLVPMFVAAGNGGRTITSCDDGKTWIANHAYETSNVDHSPNTEKGLAYGNGTFVHLLGWGAPTSVKVSHNGIDWKRIDKPRADGGLAFVEKPTPMFVALGGYGGCKSSPDGEVWKDCPAPPYNENLREAGGGGPAIGVGGDIPARFSFDGGKTWKAGGPCTVVDGFSNLGQAGGFAYGNNAFVAVSSKGDWCGTTDLGVTWKTGKLGGTADGKMAFLGDWFWAPNGNHAYVSADGTTWNKQAFMPTSTSFHSVARSAAGTFVGVERSGSSNKFYRSTDGVNFTVTTASGGASLRRVVFGYGAPSSMCPAK